MNIAQFVSFPHSSLRNKFCKFPHKSFRNESIPPKAPNPLEKDGDRGNGTQQDRIHCDPAALKQVYEIHVNPLYLTRLKRRSAMSPVLSVRTAGLRRSRKSKGKTPSGSEACIEVTEATLPGEMLSLPRVTPVS